MTATFKICTKSVIVCIMATSEQVRDRLGERASVQRHTLRRGCGRRPWILDVMAVADRAPNDRKANDMSESKQPGQGSSVRLAE